MCIFSLFIYATFSIMVKFGPRIMLLFHFLFCLLTLANDCQISYCMCWKCCLLLNNPRRMSAMLFCCRGLRFFTSERRWNRPPYFLANKWWRIRLYIRDEQYQISLILHPCIDNLLYFVIIGPLRERCDEAKHKTDHQKRQKATLTVLRSFLPIYFLLKETDPSELTNYVVLNSWTGLNGHLFLIQCELVYVIA